MAKGIQLKEGCPITRNYPEHATANSFQTGDPVELNGGKIRLVAADQAILGVAQKGATGTTDTSIPVMLIDDTSIFVMWTDTTTNQSHVGHNYGLNLAAGTIEVNIGETGTTTVVIISIDERSLAGDNPARVHVRFLPAIISSGAAA